MLYVILLLYTIHNVRRYQGFTYVPTRGSRKIMKNAILIPTLSLFIVIIIIVKIIIFHFPVMGIVIAVYFVAIRGEPALSKQLLKRLHPSWKFEISTVLNNIVLLLLKVKFFSN